jgi:hypothetical protein
MNVSTVTRCVLAAAALAVAAGCAGGAPIASEPLTPVASAAGKAGRAWLSRSGHLWSNARDGARPRQGVARPKAAGDLFVALTSEVVVLQNKTWNQIGTIDPSAMACPDADWTDKKINLYVADWDCGASGNLPGVYEFKRGTSTPSFVYTAGLSDPVGVETDKHGNVYVADYFGGYVDEYKQRSNTILQQCAPPSGYGLVTSAAIDPNGNVFMVSMNDQAPWTAYLYEYRGGLSGCNATELATFPFFPGELVLDKNANLLLADQIDGVVDILPPPYTAIGSQISVPSNPFSVTINKKNDRVYISAYAGPSSGIDAVYVDAYPGGSNIATLGVDNGISSEPSGASDSQNYVP